MIKTKPRKRRDPKTPEVPEGIASREELAMANLHTAYNKLDRISKSRKQDPLEKHQEFESVLELMSHAQNQVQNAMKRNIYDSLKKVSKKQ